MIAFTCPCGKALTARDEYAGETTRCPACGRELAIPGGQEGVQAEAPPQRDRAEEGIRRPPRRPDGPDDHDRLTTPATSGMAIASLCCGIASPFCTLFTALPAIVLGVLALLDIGKSQGRKKGKGLAVAGIGAGLLGAVLTPLLIYYVVENAVGNVRQAAARMSSANNLKQIALAMHSYNDVNGALPAAAVCDANGKPLLSWRVAILPYIEGGYLYSQFKLDEPWDGPNNIKLLSQMPKTYALPGDASAAPGYTYYRVFVGDHAAFVPPGTSGVPPFGLTRGVPLTSFTDGMATTILVAEAATAVPWTKPEELDYDPNGPLPALGGHFGATQVVLADGAVRLLSRDISQQTLRAAITRDAGDAVGPDW